MIKMKINIDLTTDEEQTAQRLCDEGIGTFREDSESPEPANLSVQELCSWKLKDYLNQKRKSYAISDAVKNIN